MKNYCFVIQPFDQGDYDNRYNDVIKPVIEACGLLAYRVDEDLEVEIATDAIEKKIREATLVIAEISSDNPNVWFELGYALAFKKPIIMICDTGIREKFPFDISHRNVLTYQTGSLRDFKQFGERLKSRIMTKLRINARAEQDCAITAEERLVLKFISRDQKTEFAITPEEKITKSTMDADVVADCLRSLMNKKYLEYRYSTNGGEGFYQLTESAMLVL